MQNWNDGKAQEFKDRKVYNIGRSHLTHTGPKSAFTLADAAIEAAGERGCCEPAQPLMKPETEARPEVVAVVTAIPEDAQATVPEDAEVVLFKSPTCPNCKAAMALLDRAGVNYVAVNAADVRDLTARYGVKQAPTLVVRHGEEFEKFRGVSDIKGWLMAGRATIR